MDTQGITRLAVQNFRSYTQFGADIHARQIVITGPNGIGKTNLLEAISLLSPGRGLRNTTPAVWRKKDEQGQWGISLTLYDGDTLSTRGTYNDTAQKRRQILSNQTPITAQSDMAELLAVVWLTPQMDGLFLDEAAARRKFFDRLIYAAHPHHADHLARYEQARMQRNRALKEKAPDSLIRAWHPILVAEGVAIAAARLEKTLLLNEAFATMSTPFPLPRMEWRGAIEEFLSNNTALATEDFYHAQLNAQLGQDRIIGQTRLGVHRSDVQTWHGTKNMPADQCSTGEQKSLLLSLVLAHAAWLKTLEPDRPLIVLLDDIAAHLDPNRQQQLFDWVANLPAQIWMTGAEDQPFSRLGSDVQKIYLPV